MSSALHASVRASWGLESNAVCEAEGLRLDWNGMDYESFFSELQWSFFALLDNQTIDEL